MLGYFVIKITRHSNLVHVWEYSENKAAGTTLHTPEGVVGERMKGMK